MLVVGWRERQTKASEKVSTEKETVMDIIRHRKLLLFGHICRMPDDRLVKKCSVDGVRQRGRPPKKWTDNIIECTELTLCEALR